MIGDAAQNPIFSQIGDGWVSIICDLAEKSPHDLLRILRPHDESGFGVKTDKGEAAFRARLDEALESLQLAELGLSLGMLSEAELKSLIAKAPIIEKDGTRQNALLVLFNSDALRRYADYYFYFGIRLLAGRILSIQPKAEAKCETDLECNMVPLALAAPPAPQLSAGTLDAHPAVREYFLRPLANTVNHPNRIALEFFDDITSHPDEKKRFELWLSGLWPFNGGADESSFRAIALGILGWVTDRVNFYKYLEGPRTDDATQLRSVWLARNPLTARFGVIEIFWLARVMRAEVSSIGRVRYLPKSWLLLLAEYFHQQGDTKNEELARKAEPILRGVFAYACDLIQNSVELTRRDELRLREPDQYPEPKEETVTWREAFDDELQEINLQNHERTLHGERTVFHQGWETGKASGWSRRIITGDYPANHIIGLALSGGGIRSATFSLGVLQGLQDFDLLKYVDYLSMVSGGGFIGGWLLGNVYRTTHWLGRLTNWEDSIAHLRKYSKYLAPHTGVLSADSWTMWGIWARNAILIQLTAVSWLLAILTACLLTKPVFDAISSGAAITAARLISAVLLCWIGVTAAFNLYWIDRTDTGNCGPHAILNRVLGWLNKKLRFDETQIQRFLVFPSWLAAFLIAALLWQQANSKWDDNQHLPIFSYSKILLNGLKPWALLFGVTFACLCILGMVTQKWKRWTVPFYAGLSTIVLYLEIAGVMYLFRHWIGEPTKFGWYALVFGPTLNLLSTVLAVVLFIGLCGRSSSEATREWWTRFGAWLGMYGLIYLLLSVAAVFGPMWVLNLAQSHWSIAWGSLGGLIGTVIGGLLAGKSSKTTGTSGKGLEYLARAGALLFIAAGLLAVSTSLHVFLLNAATGLTLRDRYWDVMKDISPVWVASTFVGALLLGFLLSGRVELNIFGLNYFYRNRLMRCYLGATRWRPGMRRPDRFTGFDEQEDLALANLRVEPENAEPENAEPENPGGKQPCHRAYRGPFPIINCTLNLSGSADLSFETRKSTSFSLTSLRCGADRPQVGYAPTSKFAGRVGLGQAMAVSGAAVSPNMGYNSSPLVAFLLTMFNVRLGWWFPNPSQSKWRSQGMPWSGFYYLVCELFGLADESSAFLNVSDGGHFENLGIYELVRRRTRVIIAADGECDENLQFGSLGNLVRICETDFGARIEIDVSSVRKQESGFSQAHCAVGKITYSNGSLGWLIYLKASVTGDEDVGVAQYKAVHPAFPHESTADQFFTEDQFESYRRLGRHVVQHAFRGTAQEEPLLTVAERLFDTWTPAGFSTDSFLKHTKTLSTLLRQLRQSPGLSRLLAELTSLPPPLPAAASVSPEELCACLELTQLMEDVFIDLRLDNFWEHPDNRGWAMLFISWAKSPLFRQAWGHSRCKFGIRFEDFCCARLGLPKEIPVARV